MDWEMDLRGEGEFTLSVKEAHAFPALLLGFSSTISLPLHFFLFFLFEESGLAELEGAKRTFLLHLILH